jgi:phosphohistidine phosphatase
VTYTTPVRSYRHCTVKIAAERSEVRGGTTAASLSSLESCPGSLMNIYFLRHAEALPEDAVNIQSDAERPLAEEGKQQVARVAGLISRRGLTFDLVLTSPLTRTRETAEGLLTQLGRSPAEAIDMNHLEPGGSTKKLMKHLRSLEALNVLLVGHNPDLGEHIAYLIGSRKARVKLAKGALACVECEASPRKDEGELTLLITPEWVG